MSRIDDFLQTFARFGVHLGLEASFALLEALGNPQKRVPILHVAGSNGKGSVCTYLSAVLTEAGYRVGRYTSPHLIDWSERIYLNEEPIAEADLWAALQKVKAAIPPEGPSPTQFEVLTAAMWVYFAQRRVDVAVIEVGLGGRLDATNVVDKPLVSIITSISLEHTERLGDTLAKIAFEKAGILKENCPALIGEMPEEAAAVISRCAYDRFCPTLYPQPAKDCGNGWASYASLEIYELEEGEVALLPREFTFQLPLQGAVQLKNVSLAIAALQILRQESWKIPDRAIIHGIAKTRWPGRLQWYTWQRHRILIDGAHNPDSALVLRQFVDECLTRAKDEQSRVHWVMGVLATKNHREMLETLLRSRDSLYLVPIPDHKSADLPQLAHLACQVVCPHLAHSGIYEDVQLGLKAAIERAEPADLVVLCGSLYLLGHFFAQEKRSPTQPDD
ncbi:MAG: folylpolyglutamate synthase/dihydrofolate synthase family protein [Synechococcales bacterium]|nr:folylpolyglutamate synthase/dihydrofolate synthase family protein [Synechococcales bacterium]